MPLKIRWGQKDYLSIALMLFGACGLFQAFVILIAQIYLSIGNYFVIIIIPIGVTLALFYSTTIIYDSFAQVERKRKLSKQFQKQRQYKTFKRILIFPIMRPILIVFASFIAIFLLSYTISYLFLNNLYSFIIAENLGTIVCLVVANAIEKNYAKIIRY